MAPIKLKTAKARGTHIKDIQPFKIKRVQIKIRKEIPHKIQQILDTGCTFYLHLEDSTIRSAKNKNKLIKLKKNTTALKR